MILENPKLSNNKFSSDLLFLKCPRSDLDLNEWWKIIMNACRFINVVQQRVKTSSSLCLDSSSHDHVLPQHHAGHTGRREEDELHGPRWETHHGALGEGRAHHQPWDQPLRGFSEGGRWWGHLHPPGTAGPSLSWLLHMWLIVHPWLCVIAWS